MLLEKEVDKDQPLFFFLEVSFYTFHQNIRFDIFAVVKYPIYIITIISICLFCFSCKTDPDFSQTRIAYNVLVDPSTDDYDVFIMDLEGGNPINISNNQSLDWVYSAYGDKLYVISDRDTCNRCYFLYETDAKGSYWNRISQTLIQDSWVSIRTKGTEIIIKPFGKSNEPFQIIDLSGNTLSKVNPNMDYFNDPCFSPDGKSIVFRGYNGDVSKSNEAELYSYHLETGEKNRITKYADSSSTFGHYQYHASPPRWNKHLNKITYSSSSNGESNIKAIDLQKQEPKTLTQRNVKSIWHDISSNGKYMAYDGQLDFKADSTTSQIFIMDFDKRSSKKITVGHGYKQGPVFVAEK